jgi:amidase
MTNGGQGDLSKTGLAAFAALLTLILPLNARAATYNVVEKSIAELESDLRAHRVTSVDIVKAYLARIDALDRHGPNLQSVLAINPHALVDAQERDAEIASGRLRGPLEGIPILVKDNIETEDPMPTTAGSLALAHNLTGRDSPLVARLRAAGAIILGKTNLSEWANIRSARPISGWSALGGLTRNPYATDRSTCGSSAGSGAATAASFAAAAVGTETDGSIVCPASMNGIVGLKPTVGLVPRTFIVPISRVQDTPGPMTRSVADAALMLTIMAGSDAQDPATAEADAQKDDYRKYLAPDALAGKRIGVMHTETKFAPDVDELFSRAVAQLRAAGATVIDVAVPVSAAELGKNEFAAMMPELKADLNAYLATTPATVTTRTLADVIAFNKANADVEMPFYKQERFELAEGTKGLDDPDYRKARAAAVRLARDALDKALGDDKLDALIAPTASPAATVDLLEPDHFESSSQLPAVAGYPHLTVPIGVVKGLPVGLSFIGPAWSEGRLIALGFAFEQRSQARRQPTYVRTEALPGFAAGVAPAGRSASAQ